jgi:kumamolisin
MFNTTIKKLLGIACLVGLVSVGAWYLAEYNPFGFRASEVTLSGSTPEAVSDSTLVRHASPELKLEIVVGLKSPNEADLDLLIARQQDPQSSDYLNFLSVDDFTARFAPAQTDVDKVTDYLRSNGIAIKRVYKNRLVVHAEGTVAQLEKAFHVKINQYQYRSGVIGAMTTFDYVSNDSDPSIPVALKDIVEGVLGLNTLDRLESRVAKPMGPAPQVSPGALSPQDVATAYNFPNANNRNGMFLYSGKGQTLAIVTAEGYDPNDVNTYWSHHGIKRGGKLIDIPINGSTKATNDETTLDLELAGSQVPNADIRMYIAVDARFINFAMAFNQMAIDNEAASMSVSWGACESRSGRLMMKIESIILKQAVSQGIGIFASSGDDGAYDCAGKKPKYNVDFPSSSPSVTAVGGTTLVQNGGSRISEEAWAGSGGGVSQAWDKYPWQHGPGVPTDNHRNTADVSMDADPYTGYSYYFQGKWAKIGGTSASAPEWNSLWVLATEAAGRRLGSANPIVYRIGRSSDYRKAFTDITAGDNGAGRGPGYKARPNWDHPTGWGVPNGEGLVGVIVRMAPSLPKP